jgi:predicted trehalose synthase
MGGKRDAYVERLKSQLDEWNASIDRLEETARVAKSEAQLEYRERLATLRAKRDNLREKIGEVQKASEDAWEILKDGVEKAQSELKSALDEAKQRVTPEKTAGGPTH